MSYQEERQKYIDEYTFNNYCISKSERKAKIIEKLRLIEEDCESDVNEFEGQPFTTRNVSIFNGRQNAMIQALANIVRELITVTGD